MTKARTNSIADDACAAFTSAVDALVIGQLAKNGLPSLPVNVTLSGTDMAAHVNHTKSGKDIPTR